MDRIRVTVARSQRTSRCSRLLSCRERHDAGHNDTNTDRQYRALQRRCSKVEPYRGRKNSRTGYASLDKASTILPIKARTHLKHFCGHYMDDQFGQELFPGTLSLFLLSPLRRREREKTSSSETLLTFLTVSIASPHNRYSRLFLHGKDERTAHSLLGY